MKPNQRVQFSFAAGSICVSILGYAATGCRASPAHHVPDSSQVQSAKTSLHDLQSVAEIWRADHGSECPTPQRLKDDGQISAHSNLNDAWGSPWKISCCDDTTTAISDGPDKIAGTTDDIYFPPDDHCK